MFKEENMIFTDLKDMLIKSGEAYGDKPAYVFKTEVEGDSHIAIPIDSETSKLFPKGIYYCFAKVIDSTTNSIQTVIGANDCMIYVR